MSGKRRTYGLGAALLGALLLSACGQGPTEQYITLVRDAFKEGEPRREPTRAQLNELPYAIIAARREGATNPAYLSAITANDGYVTYQSPAGRSFTLKGGAIVAHRGLGYDLVGFNSSPDDPLTTPTPLAEWPKSTTRVYQMRGGDNKIYTRSVVCVPTPGERVDLEIKEVVFDVVEVEDRCRSGTLDFTNRYWVAADTGFVWKSTQWTGPKMFPLILEIIRPYGG